MDLNGSTCRTPALHRAIVDHWRLSAPANDSDIIPRHRPGVGKPEFEPLLPALKTWRDLCEPAEPLSTNWLAAAANDNVPDERPDPYEDKWRDAPPPPSIDSEIETRPRPEEIMRAMGDVEIAYPEASDSPAVVVGGDMDVHPDQRIAIIGGTPCAPLARMGALRFASGETYEIAPVHGESGAIKRGLQRIPRGALTHCGPFKVRDRHTAWRGAEDGKIDPSLVAPSNSLDERIDAERLSSTLRHQLGADDVAVLDAALEAKNFSDIGALAGHSGKHAERKGKVMLHGAVERLQKLLQAA
ncbi:MAG: hypothetical protein K0S56_1545 [Microvirga sp.]|jgi:hypothetical protein|nr:hypothetical protein [Microvirga sp.]